jgi:hypothetical protein
LTWGLREGKCLTGRKALSDMPRKALFYLARLI